MSERPRPSSYYADEVRTPAKYHSCGKHEALTWTGDVMCPGCQRDHELHSNDLAKTHNDELLASFELGYNACREGVDIYGALERFQREVLIPINFCEKGKYCGQVAGHEGECDDIPY